MPTHTLRFDFTADAPDAWHWTIKTTQGDTLATSRTRHLPYSDGLPFVTLRGARIACAASVAHCLTEETADYRAPLMVRGTTMNAGYCNDQGATRLDVVTVNGTAYAYDWIRNYPAVWESPLCLDADGLIIRRGAVPGWGFLPDAGELELLAAAGITLPAA